MQSMTMILFRCCMYAKLHVIWSKLLLYIFSLINHIDSLCIQALSFNSCFCTFVFLCFFALFAFYSFVSNSHFLVIIQVFFKYFSVAILSILMMNNVNIVLRAYQGWLELVNDLAEIWPRSGPGLAQIWPNTLFLPQHSFLSPTSCLSTSPSFHVTNTFLSSLAQSLNIT